MLDEDPIIYPKQQNSNVLQKFIKPGISVRWFVNYIQSNNLIERNYYVIAERVL